MTVISLKSFHKVKHSDEYTGIFIMDGSRRRGCNKYFKYFKIEKWRCQIFGGLNNLNFKMRVNASLVICES